MKMGHGAEHVPYERGFNSMRQTIATSLCELRIRARELFWRDSDLRQRDIEKRKENLNPRKEG